MKKRVAVSIKKSRPSRLSPEEQAISNMFIEEDEFKHQGKQIDLELESSESKSTEPYEYVDYGLNREESENLWETIAKQKATEINKLIIGVLATLDAVKSSEEFINKNFDTKLDIVTSPFLADIDTLITAKIKSMILSGLSFKTEEEAALFFKYVGKNGQAKMLNPIEAMERFLSETEKETSPYGKVGITRSFEGKPY